ncbi:50S ribosomal protein L11 methyltransferase [Dactylosporangium sp. AC04546]|uniref:class I SAM-dependent methyltransferase n=1 Tax=Dactylosporangium sp. AC04546 TaxID=2862460 RepID=UPI001EDE4DB9|nr:50S ribosomal protein L11 methyltransferase [Dactylosporangium sp. AC04546]WVK78172.1 50S ribosomal protein L11 methyltransferase [Dactylosporangium sp. AC04546]
MSNDSAVFVTANTRLAKVPLVPEVLLHQADEAIELWQRTEADHGGAQLPPPFWAFAWAGGQALARHVLDEPGLVAGRRVLDLAAGSGLVAIAAMLAGAAEVTAVEIDPLAVAAIEVNAAANAVRVTPLLADVLDQRVDADVVLAGDVFYSRDMTARMLGFLRAAAATGATVLAGDPGRAYLPREQLTLVAAYDVPVPQTLEDTPIKRTTVWRVNP